jgi:hypothetical protein
MLHQLFKLDMQHAGFANRLLCAIEQTPESAIQCVRVQCLRQRRRLNEHGKTGERSLSWRRGGQAFQRGPHRLAHLWIDADPILGEKRADPIETESAYAQLVHVA